MRTLTLLLFACLSVPTVYAHDLPKDGNGLLDACSVVVDTADNPSYLASLSRDILTEKVGKSQWCAGYLGAIQDLLVRIHVNLTLMPRTKVTLAGPDKAKGFWLDRLNVACVPDDKVPILQLARIVVRWLREHPERLHELKTTLAIAALRDAFPCEQLAAKEAPKPTPKPAPPKP